MPLPGFLSSIADKAQSAINASPLAGHIPGHGRPVSPDSSSQPTANEAASQGGHKSHALESIQYQLRAFQQQYSSSTTPVQKIITSQKGVALDFDSVSRDAKNFSKELYTWGQSEPDDLKDVSDRLAYLKFVEGSLAATLSQKLDAARGPFKALRDAETSLQPRRNIRAGLQAQLGKLEHSQQKGDDKKIVELKDQIRKAELDDAPQEKEIEILKRKALRESEAMKWEAMREYGEKLVLLSQAANPIVAALPSVPPTPAHPYTGGQATAAARASLQRALDEYQPGLIHLVPQTGADLSRSDTRSFGETHAKELSTLGSDAPISVQPGLPVTPPAQGGNPPFVQQQQQQPYYPPPSGPPPQQTAAPINPMALNQSPAPIPTPSTSPPVVAPVPIITPDPLHAAPAPVLAGVTPTVAETGVPVSAGADGPGPASGSLLELKSTSPTSATSTAPPPSHSMGAMGSVKYESAEEEKRRLEREARDKLLSSSSPAPVSSGGEAGPPPPAAAVGGPAKYETAEEEKKRLEREERERLLREGGSTQTGGDHSKPGPDDELPPYQDY